VDRAFDPPIVEELVPNLLDELEERRLHDVVPKRHE
jgi:hypothetical protein